MFVSKIAKLIRKGIKTKVGKRIVGLVLGSTAAGSQVGEGLPGLVDGAIPYPTTMQEAVLALLYVLGAMVLIELRSPTDEDTVNKVQTVADKAADKAEFPKPVQGGE